MTYLTLFFISFGSATLLPFGSEALYVYYINAGHNIFLLWLFASLGNTLGSIINYYLGNRGESYLESKGYISTKKIDSTKKYFNKYGGWSLLLSWVPIIGDPLTFIAGIFHYNFKYFTIIVFISKSTRYAVIALLLQSFSV